MTAARERRRSARHAPAAAEPGARVRLRGGREVAVLDLSPGGALVEGETRLLPGTHVDVHVMTPSGRVLVRSRVVRAFVSDVSSERVVYRSALAFDRHVDVGGGYPVPGVPPQIEAPPGTVYPQARW